MKTGMKHGAVKILAGMAATALIAAGVVLSGGIDSYLNTPGVPVAADEELVTSETLADGVAEVTASLSDEMHAADMRASSDANDTTATAEAANTVQKTTADTRQTGSQSSTRTTDRQAAAQQTDKQTQRGDQTTPSTQTTQAAQKPASAPQTQTTTQTQTQTQPTTQTQPSTQPAPQPEPQPTPQPEPQPEPEPESQPTTQPEPEPESWPCYDCGNTFNTYAEFVSHYKNPAYHVQYSITHYWCSCGYHTTDKQELAWHCVDGAKKGEIHSYCTTYE